MVGLLSGSTYVDFPSCLPIQEPVFKQAPSITFLILRYPLASVHGIASTALDRKQFQTLNTII